VSRPRLATLGAVNWWLTRLAIGLMADSSFGERPGSILLKGFLAHFSQGT